MIHFCFVNSNCMIVKIMCLNLNWVLFYSFESILFWAAVTHFWLIFPKNYSNQRSWQHVGKNVFVGWQVSSFTSFFHHFIPQHLATAFCTFKENCLYEKLAIIIQRISVFFCWFFTSFFNSRGKEKCIQHGQECPSCHPEFFYLTIYPLSSRF